MRAKIFSVIFIFLSSAAFCASKTLAFADYSLTAFYKESVQPGDAVFVRLVFETKDKRLLKSSAEPGTESGSLEIRGPDGDKSSPGKVVAKSELYQLDKSADKKLIKSVLLGGAPISSWAKTGGYKAVIVYKAFGKAESVIEIPFKIIGKEFVSETIPLNASNTAIKTDTSAKRAGQIDRLNKILDTKDYSGIYETGAFLPPTNATRRTSFFADRRVYAYSDGKSSTSLHYGIDYGVPSGSEVRSCGGGKVVMAEDRVTTGWSVCIEHLPGLYSLYYHMSGLSVEIGQSVGAGELIGLSGATGLATGPHLHWEIRLNMEAVSPDFFTGDFTFKKESGGQK